MLDLRDLTLPLVGAPMAGGPSTPALAAAVAAAGGLGFLAAGYRTTEQVADQIEQTRALTTRPFGVNLFVPQPSIAREPELVRYRESLTAEAAHFGAEPGAPHPDDDGWQAKLELVEAARPAAVSFTFGSPGREWMTAFARAGILTLATVTTPAEAELAVADGARALVVQGPAAGGHRGTFDPAAEPGTTSLDELLTQVGRVVPVVAAGGLSTAEAVARILGLGAVAAQIGTALLPAEEAGTNAVHRAALQSPEFTETGLTRAFSGRYARGLVNDFMRRHDPHAPLGYPEVHQITGPLRAAAVRSGDPHGTSLWAGMGFRSARPGSAKAILEDLTPQ